MKTVKSNKLPPLLVEVQYTANMAFFRRLMEYSLSVNKHYHALPVVLAICIHNTTSDLMELSTPSSTLPFLVELPCVGWAKSCYLINAGSIAKHLQEIPLNPFIAVGHFLIEQKPSLADMIHRDDKTIIMLYELAKKVFGDQIQVEQDVANSEEIANRLTLSKATIHRYCKKWNIQRPDNIGGQPQILTEASKSLMKRMVILGRLKSGVEVFNYFKAIYPRLTYNTTLNALKGLGFKAQPKRKVPLLSAKHRKARLEWALAHRYWTIDDWRKVIFSDESKINVWGSDGVEFYWGLPGSPLQPHHVIPTLDISARYTTAE
ncbi:hypothetical protein G6F38_012577 [Rhizopus arrhizus]|nr:hypothetical protein G6F38_012577 [Rhizopus arrhizus]